MLNVSVLCQSGKPAGVEFPDGFVVSTSSENAIGPIIRAAKDSIIASRISTFTVTIVRMTADLKWTMTSEISNFGFTVERKFIPNQKTTGMKWVNVGFIERADGTNISNEYGFTDKNLQSGKYLYRLKQIDRKGTFSYSSSVEVVVEPGPKEFSLLQNYPNPLNPSTIIEYTLEKDVDVSLKLYNIVGIEVHTFVNSRQEAGSYIVPFNANDGSQNLPSGVYFYRLEAGKFISTKKLTLMN